MKDFYKKHQKLIMEILRFLLVGGLATVVDFLVFEVFKYFILKDLDSYLNLTISTSLGFIFGNIVNYILSIIFVFKGAREDKSTQSFKAFMIFTLIGVIGLGIKVGIQSLGNFLAFTAYKGSEPFITWILDTFVYGVATLVVLCWNYIGRKLLIFKGETK